MGPEIQQVIALGLVAVAAGWLGVKQWRSWRGGDDDAAGCPGCGQCGRAQKPNPATRPAPQATPLITLGSPPPPRIKR